MCSDELLLLLREKYVLNEISGTYAPYKVLSLGKEKDRNYVIVKDGLSLEEDLQHIRTLIDGLTEKRFKNASYVFIGFVNEHWQPENYTGFNGNSFLHVITCDIASATSKYDKDFYYFGAKRIKQLLNFIEQSFGDI